MDKIRLESVSYVYSKGTPFEQKALDDVSVGIGFDRITGIIGHTGSGKSTMMQLLNGLTKPTEGRILLDGYDINCTVDDVFDEWIKESPYRDLSKSKAKKAMKKKIAEEKRKLCFRVGLVMQYPEYQLFEETVRRDIAYGPMNMGLSQDEIEQRVREAARFAGLDESLLEQSPFDLSGGQKRRVAIAGVIAMRPEVLVLDEPAAGLDPRGRAMIFDGIRAFQKETHSTVLIVSHSMEDMAQYCDDVIVLSDAKVVLHGEREEVFSHVDLLESVGLDIPQITMLVRRLREKGLDLPENLYTVDAALNAIRAYASGKEVSR